MLYPISYLPIEPIIEPVTFNKDYISHLEALGVNDYFLPTQFTQNPLFAHVSEFNQNIGILQTATNAIDTILQYIDKYHQLNNPSQEAFEELSNEINSVINNTTFNNIPVFSQTLQIGEEKVDLSLPSLTQDIEEYQNTLLKQKEYLQNILQNYSLNPYFLNEYNSTITSPLTDAFNYDLINPEIVSLLLT
jgi:hypothetical protein